MILKVQRPDFKSHVTTPWAIFSDILNVYYVAINSKHYKDITKGFDGNNRDPYPFDYSAIVGDNPDRIVTVEATRKNGSLLTVAFNTVGYLLNDEGKTIEKIN